MSKNYRRFQKTKKELIETLKKESEIKLLDYDFFKKNIERLYKYKNRFPRLSNEDEKEFKKIVKDIERKVLSGLKKLENRYDNLCINYSEVSPIEIAKVGIFAYVDDKEHIYLKEKGTPSAKRIVKELKNTPKVERKIIIHAGPTNSGKTYRAIERLKQAKKGVYLSPLRLLAREIFEKLNESGHPCDLSTGDENIAVPLAGIEAMTIEKLNIDEEYDIAVIDEAQLFSHLQRGGSWTKAILGLQAKEVHICCSENAVGTLKDVLRSVQEDPEVNFYQRKTKLTTADNFVELPSEVRKGDALVAFNKRNLFKMREMLKEEGVDASILFGELPPDVRLREIDKFINGETDVVVTTDAIGMGVNVPIKRLIFTENIKYDGRCERDLTTQEIKQIAGRAGRYKIYDVGEVSASSEGVFQSVKDGLRQEDDPEDPLVVFPDDEFFNEAPIFLAQLLQKFDEQPAFENYVPATPKKYRLLWDVLSGTVEKYQLLREDQAMIKNLLDVPFDTSKDELVSFWSKCSKRIIQQQSLESIVYELVSDIQITLNKEYEEMSLKGIEQIILGISFQYEKASLLASLLNLGDGKVDEGLLEFYKKKCSRVICSILEG